MIRREDEDILLYNNEKARAALHTHMLEELRRALEAIKANVDKDMYYCVIQLENSSHRDKVMGELRERGFTVQSGFCSNEISVEVN